MTSAGSVGLLQIVFRVDPRVSYSRMQRELLMSRLLDNHTRGAVDDFLREKIRADADLSVVSAHPEQPTLEEMVTLLETLFDPQHEVRKLVFYLDGIPEIRIIAGKNA